MRGGETTLFISEGAKARRGAVVELTAIVAPVSFIHQLGTVVATPASEEDASDNLEASDDHADSDDGSDRSSEEGAFDDDRLGAAPSANEYEPATIALSAYWVGASWVLDESSLRVFLETIGIRSVEALNAEFAKIGRIDAHPGLDTKLCPAFSFELVFANCQGHERVVFPAWDEAAREPSSASIKVLSMKTTRGGGAELTVRATATWAGVPLGEGIQPGWLSGDDVPAFVTKRLRRAVEGVLANWTDIPSIQLNRRLFPELADLSPQSVEETTLSCVPAEDVPVANTSAAKSTIWAPNPGKAGVWTFFPSAKLRKDYPDCDRDRSGLDCQEGEVLSLAPQKTQRLGNALVVTVPEGRVELADFDTSWHELKRSPGDECIVWDIYRIVEDWSSD